MDISNLLKVNGSYSATVEMWLHINGQCLSVVQAGHTALKLEDTTARPTGPASLEIVVDGESRRSAVMMIASDDGRWIEFSRTV